MVGLDETRTDLSRTTDDYVYDGQGKRLIKVSNERGPGGTPLVTTRTLYIGNLYEEEIPNGQNARAYTVYYMMGQKLVGLRRANWQGQSNGQYRIVGDMLGSTTLLVDTSTSPGPQVVQRQYYKPYGEVAFSWGSSRTSIGYTGQRLDGESGLMYYGARYYDPVLSFFTQADPTVPDASNAKDYNKYLYVRGNPLRYIDTSGFAPEDYYIFVEGCAPGSWSGSGEGGCGNPNWGEYMTGLYNLYVYEWGMDWRKWDAWAKEHVINVYATTPENGADAIQAAVAAKAGNGGAFHLFGHSRGGAAVIEYLNRVRSYDESRTPKGPCPCPVPGAFPTGTFDGLTGKIKSAILIDAEDRVAWDRPSGGFGEWAKSKGINILDVDTKNDWVHHEKLPGVDKIEGTYVGGPRRSTIIDDVALPPLNRARSAWHIYTSRYMAEESKAFIATYWR